MNVEDYQRAHRRWAEAMKMLHEAHDEALAAMRQMVEATKEDIEREPTRQVGSP